MLHLLKDVEKKDVSLLILNRCLESLLVILRHLIYNHDVLMQGNRYNLI